MSGDAWSCLEARSRLGLEPGLLTVRVRRIAIGPKGGSFGQQTRASRPVRLGRYLQSTFSRAGSRDRPNARSRQEMEKKDS